MEVEGKKFFADSQFPSHTKSVAAFRCLSQGLIQPEVQRNRDICYKIALFIAVSKGVASLPHPTFDGDKGLLVMCAMRITAKWSD